MKLPPFVNDLSLPPAEYHRQVRQWCKEMRDCSPILWDEEHQNWLVFRYEDVVRVQNDYHTFSSEKTVHHAEETERAPSIIEMDPPRHRKMRSLITQAFSPRTIASMASQIEQIVDELFDRVSEKGKFDWMTDLANPLPVIVIANILGLPAENWQEFKVWTDAIINQSDERPQASRHFSRYFAQAIEKRLKRPGSDILSLLITAEVDEERLSFLDLLSFCFTLVVAGNITTTNVLGNAMLLFGEHPDEMVRLRQNPALLPTAIEEVIRYMPPSRPGPTGLVEGRVVKTDVLLCGQLVREGENVQVNRLSANFDERYFLDPERFDIGRSPNHHQSFGHGIHFCLGAPLARLEARIALEKALKKFRCLHIEPESALQQVPSTLVFGVRNLPMAFQVM